MYYRKSIFFILTFFFHIVSFYSQIGIGTNTPNEKAILEVRSLDKGVLFPSLTRDQRDQISTIDMPNGLFIYNLTENCFNYWNAQKGLWGSLCDAEKPASMIIECDKVSVKGKYLFSQELTSEEYLEISISVIVPGKYKIEALPENIDDGYYFSYSGEFLIPGTYKIKVPGYGKPTNTRKENKFSLVLKSNSVELQSCQFNIKVEEAKVDYKFYTVSGTKVYGDYVASSSLDPKTNYLEIQIYFQPQLLGSSVHAYTDVVEGVYFETDPDLKLVDTKDLRSGYIYQKIILKGYGTLPEEAKTLSFTVRFNTTANITTLVKINVTKPKDPNAPKQKLIIYGIGMSSGNPGDVGSSQLARMVLSERNFGDTPKSIVKCPGFSTIDAGDDPSVQQLKTDLLGNTPPDIVITGAPFHDPNAATIMKQYLEKGGIVFCFMEETDPTGVLGNNVKQFLDKLLGLNLTRAHGGAAGTLHEFKNISGDPILNGPFGKLAGLSWGEDASTTAGIRGLNNDFIVYTEHSGFLIPKSATLFRSKKYKFIFAGDGGFNNSTDGSILDNILWVYPFRTNGSPDYLPLPFEKYSGGKNAYNSLFTANALAWAVKEAMENGINKDKYK